jgi:uncharacterized protein (DUF362 family)/Pyruvate/2-oxoacid:ferredoxin oxidoreductase delta subunit
MSQRPVVAIARCADYEADAVKRALDESLLPLGGMQAFVREGDTVFLKVNLLMKAEPDRAVTTHPALVRAVAELVRAAGGRVLIGDSPGGRTSRAAAVKVFEASGMASVAADVGAELVLLDETVKVPVPDSGRYAFLELGRQAVEADVLISLPKFKTHGFMTLTGAVKNQFGLVAGLEKAQFHLKVPARPDFAEMLVDINVARKPDLAIMDAVIGMEGEGPAGGSPRPIGALLASADVFALDAVMAAMAGLDVSKAPVAAAAARRGVGPASADDVEVVGVPWQDIAPADFVLPGRDLGGGLGSRMMGPLKRFTTSRPYLGTPSGCTSCATCATNCPAKAIEMRDGRPGFDYDACIRCYCCQELCPPQVIALKRPLLVRLLVS